MSSSAFALVLVAAALHATWNALVKSSGDTLFTTVLITGFAALAAVIGLPFLPLPFSASWPYLAASACIHFVYFSLVAQAYRVTDMSLAYPLMRGAAPLIVTVAAIFFLSQMPQPIALAGILSLCTGIFAMVRVRRGAGEHRKGGGLALLNAGVIATYTLVDGVGVRLSGSPAAYTLWLFLLIGAPMTGWALVRHHIHFVRYSASFWRAGFIGGIGSVLSYGLVLWAMTLAPVSLVAALRETAILFGMAISVFVLGEHVGGSRIVAAVLIAAGAVLLKLA